ncbi:MAG: uncharacterized protein A8A55_3078 [Amphiamblys sp. WSBS2006]|nr:MAG: uncharacterized protein A8A55_3078 [Amphiamblys sp. WSBS2006]
MLNALSAGKGKVRHIEQDPKKGTVWAIGDKEAIAQIRRKLAQKGGKFADEDELGNLRKLLERSAKNENCPAWKQEKLTKISDTAELRRAWLREGTERTPRGEGTQ